MEAESNTPLPDPRLDGPSFQPSALSTSPFGPDEAAARDLSHLLQGYDSDVDEDAVACSLELLGYPPEAPLRPLEYRCSDFGALRCKPTRDDAGCVIATFRHEAALIAAYHWFKAGYTTIGLHTVVVRPARERADMPLPAEACRMLEYIAARDKAPVEFDVAELGEEFVNAEANSALLEQPPMGTEDEKLCALLVVGYPEKAALKCVDDRFSDIAMLRGPVRRAEDGRVVVTYRSECDLVVAWKWFKGACVKIAGAEYGLELMEAREIGATV